MQVQINSSPETRRDLRQRKSKCDSELLTLPRENDNTNIKMVSVDGRCESPFFNKSVLLRTEGAQHRLISGNNTFCKGETFECLNLEN